MVTGMLVVPIWVLLSIFAGVYAKQKGQRAIGFFVFSLVLSPLIGVIAVAMIRTSVVAAPVNGDSSRRR